MVADDGDLRVVGPGLPMCLDYNVWVVLLFHDPTIQIETQPLLAFSDEHLAQQEVEQLPLTAKETLHTKAGRRLPAFCSFG
jgi:hypothetical protein